MLSNVHASDVQFHLESEQRAHDAAIRAARAERREGIAAEAAMAARRRRAVWPRPIGVARPIVVGRPVGVAQSPSLRARA